MLIGWCVIGGWKNENNNLQFLGKNMFGLQQVMSFLNIVIKKWIILGPTVIYILISCKMFIVYNFSVVTEGCSNS